MGQRSFYYVGNLYDFIGLILLAFLNATRWLLDGESLETLSVGFRASACDLGLKTECSFGIHSSNYWQTGKMSACCSQQRVVI